MQQKISNFEKLLFWAIEVLCQAKLTVSFLQINSFNCFFFKQDLHVYIFRKYFKLPITLFYLYSKSKKELFDVFSLVK